MRLWHLLAIIALIFAPNVVIIMGISPFSASYAAVEATVANSLREISYKDKSRHVQLFKASILAIVARIEDGEITTVLGVKQEVGSAFKAVDPIKWDGLRRELSAEFYSLSIKTAEAHVEPLKAVLRGLE